MANTLITPTLIAKLALMNLKNNMGMTGNVFKEYKKEFTGGATGGTVNIRKPNKFRAKDGATRDGVNVLESNTSIAIDKRKHVSWEFSTLELTHSVEEYNERYIKPATIALANKVDEDLHALYADVYNAVGTPGTTPSSFADVALGARRLSDEAVPKEMRYGTVNPAAYYAIAGNLTTLNNVGMSTDAYTKGIIPNVAGFDLVESQNVQTHTVGAHGGTPLTNGVPSEGDTSIVTDGWTASTQVLNTGDVFTIAGVYAVNPVSGVSTGVLKQFVATSDVTSDGSGNATIPISIALYSSAATEDYLPYQNIDTMVADGAAITVLGTASTVYPQNILYHKNAFGLVTVPLELPDGASFKARASDDGMSIRVIKDYDIDTDADIIRLDIQYGVKTLYPELACRLVG